MILEDMDDTRSVLSMVALQNQEFDLHEFFGKEASAYYDQGACGFITRKQSFCCYASDNHGLVFENVCGSIFEGDEPLVRNEYYDVNLDLYNASRRKEIGLWRYANERFGVICIQMLINKGIFVWVPDKINSFQKEKLLEFCEEIKKINKEREVKGVKELTIDFNIFDGSEFSKIMNIDEFIIQIDSLVDDNVKLFTENMISDYVSEKHR